MKEYLATFGIYTKSLHIIKTIDEVIEAENLKEAELNAKDREKELEEFFPEVMLNELGEIKNEEIIYN